MGGLLRGARASAKRVGHVPPLDREFGNLAAGRQLAKSDSQATSGYSIDLGLFGSIREGRRHRVAGISLREERVYDYSRCS